MTELSTCKACGHSVAGDQQRPVGEWVFCDPCFEKLLKPDSKPPEASASPISSKPEEPSPRAISAAVNTSEYCCCICDKSFPGKPFKQISSASVCESCYDGLLPRLENAPVRVKVNSGPLPVRPLNSIAKSDAEMFSTMSNSEASQHRLNCVACNKTLPSQAAAKVLNDEFYCPDCHHRLANSPAQHGKTETPSGSEAVLDFGLSADLQAQTPIRNGVLICDSCERRVISEAVVQHDGLMICLACEAYDLQAALKMAKIRHRTMFDSQRATLIRS